MVTGRPLARFAVLGALLALAVEPAAAQTSSSVTERLIRDLNRNLLYVAVPVTVLVEGILLYTVFRYRNNEDPRPTQENRRLEITWTLATAVVLLIVGVASYQVMANQYVVQGASEDLDTEREPVEVAVVAQKYSWTFYYNDTGRGDERVSSTGTLVLPVDRPIVLRITSVDWIHSFHVPALGLKQDAMPGAYNQIETLITEEGTYQLYCAEYCGVGHARMLGEVETVDGAEYRTWLRDQRS